MPALVRWILPFRDAAATLPRAVASIQAQSVRDWELVLVDDGSRDGGALLARRLAAGDPRIELRATARPRGIATALALGLEGCRTPFVARLDADDWAHPERLARQLALFGVEPALAVVDARVLLHRGGAAAPRGMRVWLAWIHEIESHEDFAARALRDSPVLHPAVMIRTEALRAAGGYRDGDFPEDHDLWLRMLRRGFRFGRAPGILTAIEDRPERATRCDPRYRRDAIRRLVQEHVRRYLLPRLGPYALLGAGRGGRRWGRFLCACGRPPLAVLDVDPRKIGRPMLGLGEVLPFAEIASLPVAALLVAVGRRDAPPLVEAALKRLRPDWCEGRNYWFLAC